MIAVEAATIVVFILIDPLVVFFRKRKSHTVTLFFWYFTGKYVRTEWITVSNFNIDRFQIRVISSIG